MAQPWFLRPPPTEEQRRAVVRRGIWEFGAMWLLLTPVVALAASDTGKPPFRAAVAFALAPIVFFGGLWAISKTFPSQFRTRKATILAIGALAGLMPGAVASFLITSGDLILGAIIGALVGWSFMAWHIRQAHILPSMRPNKRL